MTTQVRLSRKSAGLSEQRLLLKILIGAAWLDGMIQMEERQYLRSVAGDLGLANDGEIYPLLNELRAVKAGECDRWIHEYLGDRPTKEAVQGLLEAISGLVYADGSIGMEEAQLLMRLQEFEGISNGDRVLRVVRQLYHRWVAVLDDVK
jgi:uncharacterized tellurite resistance protein B-like protein